MKRDMKAIKMMLVIREMGKGRGKRCGSLVSLEAYIGLLGVGIEEWSPRDSYRRVRIVGE